MEFRVKEINLVKSEKDEWDFPTIIKALDHIESLGWDLNSKLYELMNFGFLQGDGKMVMLLGAWPGGTEELICSALVAGQMGSPIIPIPIPGFLRGEVVNVNPGHDGV